MARKSASAFTGIANGRERQRATLALNRWRQKYRSWERQADQLPNIQSMGGHVDFGLYLDYTTEELAVYKDYNTFAVALQARESDIDARVQASIQRLSAQQALERSSAAAKAAARGVKRGRGRPRGRSTLRYGQHVYLILGYNHGQGANFNRYIAEAPPVYEVEPYEEWIDL